MQFAKMYFLSLVLTPATNSILRHLFKTKGEQERKREKERRESSSIIQKGKHPKSTSTKITAG